jgi:hypothetical protein
MLRYRTMTRSAAADGFIRKSGLACSGNGALRRNIASGLNYVRGFSIAFPLPHVAAATRNQARRFADERGNQRAEATLRRRQMKNEFAGLPTKGDAEIYLQSEAGRPAVCRLSDP